MSLAVSRNVSTVLGLVPFLFHLKKILSRSPAKPRENIRNIALSDKRSWK